VTQLGEALRYKPEGCGFGPNGVILEAAPPDIFLKRYY
jgi:hypothetical protein